MSACTARMSGYKNNVHSHRTRLAPAVSPVFGLRILYCHHFLKLAFRNDKVLRDQVNVQLIWRPTEISKSWKKEWRRSRLLSKPKFLKRKMKKSVELPWFIPHKASRMGLAASSPGLGGHSGGDIIRRCNCYSVNNLSLDRKCYRHSLTFNTQGDKTNINPK